MGRKVLLAIVGWLTLCEVLGETEKTVNSSVVKDNESAESAPRPRLYQNIQFGPAGVYASGAPYAAYSFHAPAILAAPSQLAPVNAGFLRNLKDSYGKLAETPQTTPYRTAFPQQYVQLQDLPPHLAQPLVSAAAPSFQFKAAPNYFFGPHSYKVPSLQLSVAPTSLNRFGSHSQPLVYAENIKSFAPSSNLHSSLHKFHTTPHSNGNNVHFSNAPTFQRLQEKPASQAVTSFSASGKDSKQQATASHDEKGQIQASPAQTSITAIVNGKKTVVNLETKPPLPLLDLNLLEPLTFDNPLVPQVQHFLPKISSATYHKLPSFNANEAKKNPKEFVVTKTKSYDSGYIKGKPQNDAPKKKQNKPRPQSKPANPTIVLNGNPNGEEFSYEIDTPNHKETYNEQVIKYNKQTNMQPVEYSYNQKTHKEPEVYSFVHSSKEPLKVTHVEYNSDDEKPKHLVYTLSPEENDEEPKEEVHQHSSQESDDSGESSAESEDDGSAPLIRHEESPRHHQNSHSHSEHHESPKYKEHNEHKGHNDGPRHPVQHSSYGGSPKSYHHSEHRSETPKHSSNPHYEGNSHSHSEGHSHPKQHSYNHHGTSHGHPQQHNYNHHEGPQSTPQQQNYNHHETTHGHPQQHNYNHHEGPQSPPQQQNYNHHETSHGHPQQHNNNHHEGTQAPYHMHFHVRHESPRHEEQHHHGHQGQHYDQPRQSHYLKVEHRGQEYKQKPNQEVLLEVIHTTPEAIRDSTQYSQPLTISSFQPITPEYEEDIRILPTHKPHADIKVDPNQHVQKLGPALPQQHSYNTHPSPAPQKAPPQQVEHPATLHPHPYNSPQEHVVEKSKRVIIKENEETPEEMHMRTEQVVAEMIDREENGEEDFEKAYKESAFGFPAYEQSGEEVEKDIYDSESYGAPKYHNEYKIENTPFQQYQREGDEFPKFARLTYKDAKDDKQEDYYLDYSVHKPESVADLYKSKVNYYKMFKKNRPEKLLFPERDEQRKGKKSEQIILAPSFDFFNSASKPTSKQSRLFAQYKVAPIKYEYDYSKGAPRDSTAYASRPYHKYSKTHFVEPQFQYGFEPLSAPIVIDSELAAMASNNSPESEKPGTRKKVYKENWYIKKTSTTGNKSS